MVNLISGIAAMLHDLGSAMRPPDRRGPGWAGEPPDEMRLSAFWVRLWRGQWIWLGLVVVFFCIPLFVGLGRVDLENDEAIYSFAVDVILDSGDWLTPKSSPREDVAFLEKPPLKFWIVAVPIKLGLLPHNEFGLRFWDAVFGSVAFLYVFSIGRRIGGPVCGLVAVLMLFVHRPLLFMHGLRTNNMESALVLSYCGGIYHFLRWRATESGARRRWHVLAVGLYFVLGFMTKFVAVLLLPTVLVMTILLHREDRALLGRDWRTALAVSLLAAALIAPWFLYQHHQFGTDLWANIGAHVFARFKAYVDPSHLHPWNYYFSELLAQLRVSQTLVFTIAGAALVIVRTLRSGWPEGTALLLWFGLPLGFMSFGASKLYHYAYPFLPPVALVAGYAAAVLVSVVWSFVGRHAQQIQRISSTIGRPMGRSRTCQALLLVVAVGATLTAVLTYATGNIRLAVGDLVLFRNSQVFRPLLVGLVAVALAGGLRAATWLILPLALLAVLPLGVYWNELRLLPVENHPLRSVRDCLQPICARQGGPDPRGPGVWVENEQLTHPLAYYLRRLGPWQQRDIASDPTVYVHLYVPSRFRPVLISRARFEEFTRRVRAGDPELIARAARKAAVDPVALAASAGQTVIPFLRFADEVLMLPGPYGACAPEYPRDVSRQPN